MRIVRIRDDYASRETVGTGSIGMEELDQSAVLAEGRVTANGGGILASGGGPDFRNLRVSVRAAIELAFVDFTMLGDADVPLSETALNMPTQSEARVADRTMLGDPGISW